MDFGLKKIFTDTLSKSTQVQQKKAHNSYLFSLQ